MSGLTKRKSSTVASGALNDESSNKSSLSDTSVNPATSNNEPQSTNSNGNGSSSRSKRLKGLVNNEYCSYCDEGGSLINCDRCPASFHLLCHEPPLDHIPKGEFICNACKYSHSNGNGGQNWKSRHQNGGGIFDSFIEQAKSLNPRQMQLGEELSRLCDLKIPGLNRVKWWIHEKCKLNESGNNSSNNSKNSAKQCFSLLTSSSSCSNGNTESNGDAKDRKNTQFGSNNISSLTTSAGNVQNGINSDQSEIKRFICFICQKITKTEERLTCDFCPLVFHSMCLFEAHGIVYTSRDKVWMCPNHIEHYLDINVLKSSRLSERLELWNRFTLKEPAEQIVRRFVAKCASGGTFLQRNSRVNMQPTDVPDSVKQVYSNPIEIKYDEYCEIEDDLEDQNILSTDDLYKIVADKTGDNQESEKLLCALEALQLLSESIEPARFSYDPILDSYLSIRMPDLSKSITKPRAFLLHIPFSKLVNEARSLCVQDLANQLVKGDTIESTSPILMTQRCLTLGSDQDLSDVCLEGLRQRRRCQFVSGRHACIYYDDESDTYELLNYSEHGTIVDRFVYGLRLETERPKCTFFPSNESDEGDECKYDMSCDCQFVCRLRGTSQWEGAAHLKHGSLIQIGCLSFLFVIVDYDFKFTSDRANEVARFLSGRGSKHHHLNDSKNSPLEKIVDPVSVINEQESISPKLNEKTNHQHDDNVRFNTNKRQLLI